MLPDFFLDESPEELRDQMVKEGAKPAFGVGAKSSSGDGPAKTFEAIKSMLSEELCKSVGGTFQFKLTGKSLDHVYLHMMDLFFLNFCR